MARVNPQEYADKWARRTSAATEDYRKGVQRVTEAPGAAAARQADLMLRKLTESITSGKWAARVGSVSLQEWKDSASGKGVARIAAGVQSAAPGMQQMAQRLLAAVDQAVAAANQTPRGDLDANINRMVTYAREMAARSRDIKG